jgi:hypothetical protein
MSEEKPFDTIGGGPEAELPEGGPGTRGGFVAEAVRKAVLTGVGALFLTEEGARKLAREWKLPKDLAGYVVAQAQGAKDEVLRIVSQEVRRFFESEAFRREVMKLIGSMAIEVKAEIRFKEAQKGKSAPSARHRARHAEEPEDEHQR